MIHATITFKDEASKDLAKFISALTGPQAAEFNEQGGLAARNAAIAYHRQFDQSGGWRGKRYLGTGPNGGSSFGADVARGWSLTAHDSGGATISNDANYYAFKVTGGTIKPKRGKYLTIPLIPEAKGLRVKTYEENTGKRLFSLPGRKVLFEATKGEGTSSLVNQENGFRKGEGRINVAARTEMRPVYALLTSVTQGPWPHALPPNDVLVDAYADTYRESLIEVIEES